MKTRKDYLEKRCSHREYYAQFVTPEIRAVVRNRIGGKTIAASSDPNLNDIPLSRWDALQQESALKRCGSLLREAGDGLTLAGIVCIAKEAARQIQEEGK